MTLTPTIMCVNCVTMFLCLPDSSKFIHLIFANCVLLYLLYTAYQRGGNHRSHLLSGEQCSEKTIQFKIQSFLIFSWLCTCWPNMKAMQANPALKLYFQPKIKLCIDDPFSGKENRKILIFVQCQTVFIFSILGHKTEIYCVHCNVNPSL